MRLSLFIAATLAIAAPLAATATVGPARHEAATRIRFLVVGWACLLAIVTYLLLATVEEGCEMIGVP